MAINTTTTASSSPLARTDTAQLTAPQQPAQGNQPPRLHAGPTPNSPRSQLRAAARDGDGTAIKRLLANDKPDVSATAPPPA